MLSGVVYANLVLTADIPAVRRLDGQKKFTRLLRNKNSGDVRRLAILQPYIHGFIIPLILPIFQPMAQSPAVDCTWVRR
jgi:hypothetical protein